MPRRNKFYAIWGLSIGMLCLFAAAASFSRGSELWAFIDLFLAAVNFFSAYIWGVYSPRNN